METPATKFKKEKKEGGGRELHNSSWQIFERYSSFSLRDCWRALCLVVLLSGEERSVSWSKTNSMIFK